MPVPNLGGPILRPPVSGAPVPGANMAPTTPLRPAPSNGPDALQALKNVFAGMFADKGRTIPPVLQPPVDSVRTPDANSGTTVTPVGEVSVVNPNNSGSNPGGPTNGGIRPPTVKPDRGTMKVPVEVAERLLLRKI